MTATKRTTAISPSRTPSQHRRKRSAGAGYAYDAYSGEYICECT